MRGVVLRVVTVLVSRAHPSALAGMLFLPFASSFYEVHRFAKKVVSVRGSDLSWSKKPRKMDNCPQNKIIYQYHTFQTESNTLGPLSFTGTF